MAGDALDNALRLHFDSIILYEAGSHASAYQLSLLCSEELGKALLLQEYCWQYYANNWREDKELTESYLKNIFSNHLRKQKYFAYMANDFINKNPLLTKKSSIIYSLANGLGEAEKQRSTYVGLIKKGKKIDLKAKTTIPRTFAKPMKAMKQITLNNDFIAVYTSGFIRAVFGVDVYSMAVQMDKVLLERLTNSWKFTGKEAAKILKELNELEILANPLGDWEE